jgi:hypothetical protein
VHLVVQGFCDQCTLGTNFLANLRRNKLDIEGFNSKNIAAFKLEKIDFTNECLL